MIADYGREVCPLCGEPILPGNSAGLFDLILKDMFPDDFATLSKLPQNVFQCLPVIKHLLPIVKEGKTICPGSPSRAQYIEGQPRDPRPRFAYRPELEPKVRAAYFRLQELGIHKATYR